MTFTLPVVGDTTNAWGGLLNTIFQTINGVAVYPVGLVNDSGVTDNTAVLTAAELAAHNSGPGAVIYLPASGSGAFGCNFTTTYPDITWKGIGENEPSGAGGTKLCGLVSAAGTQNSVFDVETARVRIYSMAIDGGNCDGSQAYLADKALLINGVDFQMEDCSPMGGQTVSMLETSNVKRAKYHWIRPGQGKGSSDAGYYVSRTMTCTVNAGGFGLLITDGTHTFTSGSGSFPYGFNTAPQTPWTGITDVGRQISGTGITPGTFIQNLTNSTTAVLSQQCATGTALTITEYRGDCIWMNGSDSCVSNSVMNFGTKRYQGSGQLSLVHNTFTGISGCCNVIAEGGSTYQADNFYTDSSPAPADGSVSAQLTHTQITSGPGNASASWAITNWQCFQNTTSNSQPAIVENDTSCSLNITGGILHAALAQQSTSLLMQTFGNNPSFQLVNFNINTANALKQTTGYPVTFATGTSPYSGAAFGTVAGQLSFVQAGVTYGAFSAAFTPPGSTSGTSYQNKTGYPIGISLNFTATTSAATATLTIGPATSPTTNWGTWTPAITAAVGNLTGIVPPGWFYEYVYSNCTAGTIVGVG